MIENLEKLTNLKILDISYNLIKKIEGLDTLTNLKKLYLVENRLKNVLDFIFIILMRNILLINIKEILKIFLS